jgi:hypothetical protein
MPSAMIGPRKSLVAIRAARSQHQARTSDFVERRLTEK